MWGKGGGGWGLRGVHVQSAVPLNVSGCESLGKGSGEGVLSHLHSVKMK